MASISVLDFIPPALVPDIRNGTSTVDVGSYFQEAAVAANNGVTTGAGPGGTVFVPAGTYRLDRIGIRGTIFAGEGTGTVIRALTADASGPFMFDALLDRDGLAADTINPTGNGWCRDMVIDANHTGRSCLRTYGGGVDAHGLRLLNGTYGLSAGLPVWARFANIYAAHCAIGFHTFHLHAEDVGTSALFASCWADKCSMYGFQIRQLVYSNFVNCVAQESGNINFLIGNDTSDPLPPIVHSLQFIGCATEGSGVPFKFSRVRNFTLVAPRIIAPDGQSDLVILDDAQGTITEYSTFGEVPNNKKHLSVINHRSGLGSILVLNSPITYDASAAPYLNNLGGEASRLHDLAVQQLASAGTEWRGPLPVENVTAQIQPVDAFGETPGYTGLAFTSDGKRLAAFRRIGTPIFLTNGPIPSPENVLAVGEVSFSIAGSTLTFVGKNEAGVVKTFRVTAAP